MCFIFHCFRHSKRAFTCILRLLLKYTSCKEISLMYWKLESVLLDWIIMISSIFCFRFKMNFFHFVYFTFSSLSLKDTHLKNPQCFTQQQRGLAASDLLHMLTYSIKFYTLHFHISEYSCFKDVIYQIVRKRTVASFKKFWSKIWNDFCLNDTHREKLIQY